MPCISNASHTLLLIPDLPRPPQSLAAAQPLDGPLMGQYKELARWVLLQYMQYIEMTIRYAPASPLQPCSLSCRLCLVSVHLHAACYQPC